MATRKPRTRERGPDTKPRKRRQGMPADTRKTPTPVLTVRLGAADMDRLAEAAQARDMRPAKLAAMIIKSTKL